MKKLFFVLILAAGTAGCYGGDYDPVRDRFYAPADCDFDNPPPESDSAGLVDYENVCDRPRFLHYHHHHRGR